jgi:AraC-like DNA-binding protein
VLRTLRSDLAKRHLADRDLSISQIAWMLGYSESSAFSTAYKRTTGTSPGKVQRLMRTKLANTG